MPVPAIKATTQATIISIFLIIEFFLPNSTFWVYLLPATAYCKRLALYFFIGVYIFFAKISFSLHLKKGFNKDLCLFNGFYENWLDI
jgi:hypothetical protein